MLGTTLGGRYQIIRYLGGGGFGQTYLSEDLHLPGSPHCVVKQLKPKLDDPRALQTARRFFDQEANVLYTLGSHDQIPQLFAHFEENQEFYLVQEFVEGDILSQELRSNVQFNESQVIALLQDVLKTLAFVHEQQVIHRDIKPSNLIRRKRDQRIVLIDFGIVKQIGVEATGNQGETSITIAIGSTGYMPNEQLAGKPRYSSDIYAVGMIGIQALTGCYPAQLREDVRTGELIWRDQVDVSDDLSAIIDTMTRYDFRQRYQSAMEALSALNSLAGAPNHTTIILPIAKSSDSDGHLIWCERADELFQQQRYPEAVACYEKVLQIVPNDYMIWFKRGIALENCQQYQEAVSSFDKVIEIQPQDYLAWFKRGKALEQIQQYDQAIASYDQVIELQPDNYWAWHDRGQVLEGLNRYEEAVTAYNRAVQLKPDFQLAVESRKRVLRQLKRVDQLYHLQHYEEAIASCDKAISDKPDDALAWLMRGMALENSNQYREAVESYEKVVTLQPDDHLAWFKRGAVLEKLGRYEEAIQSYEKAAEIQPQNSWAWHDRGRVLETLHHYEDAMISYDKAIQIKPDFQAALDGRQRMLKKLQKGMTLPSSPFSTEKVEAPIL
ncbi:MAG: tetratricopeptide repeat protein [Elainellaceae cyanobacterium]